MEAIFVGGYFDSDSITVGKTTLTNKGTQSYSTDDGMLIKYKDADNEDGYEVEWATSVGGNSGDEITCITETSDGGFFVGGYFSSNSITVGETTLTNKGTQSYSTADGMLIKYKKSDTKKGEYEVEWATSVGGNMEDEITCITETSDGGYICRRIF